MNATDLVAFVRQRRDNVAFLELDVWLDPSTWLRFYHELRHLGRDATGASEEVRQEVADTFDELKQAIIA